jgi:DNA-binding winged helix-turn-helix (wHTH) protein
MILRFGACEIDSDRRRIVREGEERALSRKAFDLLLLLIDQRPKVLSKNLLINHIWADTFVADANLAILIADVRAALGDSAHEPRMIKTHHRVGYSFIAPIMEISDASALPMVLLVAGKRRIALRDGTVTVGRDQRCDVILPHRSVSRIHARLMVSGDSVAIEDNASKNGTRVDEEVVVGRILLRDGQRITFGSIATLIVIGRPSNSSTFTASSAG